MNAKLTLTNGKEVWTEDIKCPKRCCSIKLEHNTDELIM